MEEANQLLRDAALARKVVLEIEFDVAGEWATQLHTLWDPAPPCLVLPGTLHQPKSCIGMREYHTGIRKQEDLKWIDFMQQGLQAEEVRVLILGVPYENVWIGNSLPLPLASPSVK